LRQRFSGTAAAAVPHRDGGAAPGPQRGNLGGEDDCAARESAVVALRPRSFREVGRRVRTGRGGPRRARWPAVRRG